MEQCLKDNVDMPDDCFYNTTDGNIETKLNFKCITPDDKNWMQPLLDMSSYNSEEYNFAFTYLWRKPMGYKVCKINNYLIIKSSREKRPPTYLYPPGSGDIAPVIKALEQDALREEIPLVFHTLLTEQKLFLEKMYPGKFQFLENEGYYDYVYESQSLITLAGKKLHSKRNHINRFKQDFPDWSYEPISGANMHEVIAMSKEWLKQHDEDESVSFMQEARSVAVAIEDFFDLMLDGGLIRANGKVIAFSMGDRLNHNTYLVHIEKAFGDIPGAYAMINQQFAEHYCSDYLYINREDASGRPGLIKAKESYRPAFLVEKYEGKLVEKL